MRSSGEGRGLDPQATAWPVATGGGCDHARALVARLRPEVASGIRCIRTRVRATRLTANESASCAKGEIRPPLFLEAPAMSLLLQDADLVRLWCGDAARAVFPAQRFLDASSKHLSAQPHIASILECCKCVELLVYIVTVPSTVASMSAPGTPRCARPYQRGSRLGELTSALRLCKTHHDADLLDHHSRSHQCTLCC